MRNVESLLHQYLKEYGFIDYDGGLRYFNDFGDFYTNYLDAFFYHRLKQQGIHIVMYTEDFVTVYGGHGDQDEERTTFAWSDGKKIEMCSFVSR